MSFNGPAEHFIVDWVNGRLGRNTKEAALSVQVDPTDPRVSTLFSYAVPIASIFDRKFLIISDKSALERSSVTTRKHLRWVEAAALSSEDGSNPYFGVERFPHEQRAYLTRGRIPTTVEEWHPMLVAFDARNEGSPGPLRGYNFGGEL